MTFNDKNEMVHRIVFSVIVFLLLSSIAKGQNNRILSPSVSTLQVVVEDDWLSMPIMDLRGQDCINISFDDMSHEYKRYAYRVEHCDANWEPSTELFPSDFCEGFSDGNIIDDFSESINTNELYTHYKVAFPNDKCRLKMAGNYRVIIYDENTKDTAAIACFGIVDQLVTIRLEATSNTDIDVNGKHQQVNIVLDYGNLRVTNPSTEISTKIYQNGMTLMGVKNPTPQTISHTGLHWFHNRDLIFEAGNEYRKFEVLDVSHTTMGLESIGWDGHQYHAYVWPDEPRPNYIYDEDANGAFYIRNSDNIENDYASQYVWVHFQLKIPRYPYPIFLNGKWTNDQLTEDYEMEYNDISHCYEKKILLKQGYYSYRYLSLDSQGRVHPLPSEGNFYQTENTYQCLIYYRGQGERTDRLVGYQQIQLR